MAGLPVHCRRAGLSRPGRAAGLQVRGLRSVSRVQAGSGWLRLPPRCVHSAAQRRAGPPGGALFPAMAGEQAPQHGHKSGGCFIASTNVHRPERVHGQAQPPQGEGRGYSASREKGERLPSSPNDSTSMWGSFKKTSCDSKVQPGLRTTDLQSRCLTARQSEIRLNELSSVS